MYNTAKKSLKYKEFDVKSSWEILDSLTHWFGMLRIFIEEQKNCVHEGRGVLLQTESDIYSQWISYKKVSKTDNICHEK